MGMFEKQVMPILRESGVDYEMIPTPRKNYGRFGLEIQRPILIFLLLEGSWWGSKTSGDGEPSSSCLVTDSCTRSTTASLIERTGGSPLRFLSESFQLAQATVWPAPLPGRPGDLSTRR